MYTVQSRTWQSMKIAEAIFISYGNACHGMQRATEKAMRRQLVYQEDAAAIHEGGGGVFGNTNLYIMNF